MCAHCSTYIHMCNLVPHPSQSLVDFLNFYIVDFDIFVDVDKLKPVFFSFSFFCLSLTFVYEMCYFPEL